MIRVQVLKLWENEVVEERQVLTLYDLEQYISRITSTDIKYNHYHIQKTPKTLEFFKRTYVPNFFVEFDDYIALSSLKFGQRRVKNYKKKTNSNRILENTLLRIQTRLNKAFRSMKIRPTVIMPRMTQGRYEKIKIKLDDMVQSKEHTLEIEFDKFLWDFNIISVKTSRPNIIKIISQAIRYTTTPTKIYREKNKVIENENNAE